MRTRYGVSPWIDRLPGSRRPEYSRLRGAQTAQVAIVGGGLTGCLTAYACAVAGLKVMLIEGDRLGQGASARVAGLLLAEPGPSFRDVEKLHGVRAARTVFDTWRRASLEGGALLRRLKITCGLHSLDDLLVSTGHDDKELKREYEARRRPDSRPGSSEQRTVAAQSRRHRVADATAVDPYRARLAAAAASWRDCRAFAREVGQVRAARHWRS
jgi:glycine/D-amino acid oxidase-like deaminating enzyme